MSSAESSLVPLKLAVLISGGGSTMMNLHQKITVGELHATIPLLIANRSCTGIEKARAANIPTETISPKEYSSIEEFSEVLFARVRSAEANLVVLAGFLSRIIIPKDFTNRVMNIHPSLIPAFCGKGMYGHHVHEAVIARGCKVSGCTVHFCDNEYDHGPIILQRTVAVQAEDNAEQLAARVQAAECEAYPEAVRLFADGRLEFKNGKIHILQAKS